MEKPYEFLKAAYYFFIDAEEQGIKFRRDELSLFTGENVFTIRTFIAKQWSFFLWREETSDKDEYSCYGLTKYSLDEFVDLSLQETSTDNIESKKRDKYAKIQAIRHFEKMMEDETKESRFQAFLEQNFWMFGSEYCELLERRNWTRDEVVDFMFRRTTDGYLEGIEIKTPLSGQKLFTKPANRNFWYPKGELSMAIGQIMHYLEELDAFRHTILSKDKEDVSKIKIKIFIGRDLDPIQISNLRRLNSHLNRIEIMTFDQLLKVAKQAL